MGCQQTKPAQIGDRIATELSGPDGKPLQVDQRLLPDQVLEQFATTLDRMETEMGMPINRGASKEARIKAILDSGSPIPPELYYAVHQKRMMPDVR